MQNYTVKKCVHAHLTQLVVIIIYFYCSRPHVALRALFVEPAWPGAGTDVSSLHEVLMEMDGLVALIG